MTMAGYYKMPDASSAALVDGWLYTNDLAFTDEEGFVYMLGRADDIINVGGEKVSPLEIENAATEHPKVFDAACIGVEDPVMGQVPALFVAMEDVRGKDNVGNMCGADQVSDMCRIEEVREFLASRLERYKRPSYIIRVNEIPRNRMQKLDRKAVRKLWEERQLQGDS
jgi:long-chain acyl-CoA synthetase